MNIFQLSETGCPVEAAEMQCDKHVVKMACEQNQILCDAFVVKDITAPFKKCNPNHPSTRWARTSLQNYQWSINHAYTLCKEYTRRYNKRHKSEDVTDWCNSNIGLLDLPDIGITPFATAISEDTQCRKRIRNFDDLPVYQQYRLYYVFDKPFAKWDRLNNTPQWFLDMRQKYANVLP